MTQSQIRVTELATQQADTRQVQSSVAPMMLLDDEALKHVSGCGPAGGWNAATGANGPAGGWI